MPAAIDFRFDAKNRKAQRAAARHGAQLVREVSQETKRALRLVIVRAIRRGVPPLEAARQIREMVGLTQRQAMAVAHFREELENTGLIPSRIDAAVSRLAAKKLRERAENIARTECLPGEALIDGAVVWAAFRRRYEGLFAKVRTSDGSDFSATPNHPMLTHRGWVPAGLLDKGDYLISSCVGQDSSPPGNKYVTYPPTSVRQIFDSLAAIGIIERRRSSDPDFHGDGIDSEVDIARADDALRVGVNVTLTQQTLENLFTPPDLSTFAFCAKCSRILEINQSPCFCHSPQLDAAHAEPVMDRVHRYAKTFCDALGSLASLVSFNDLVYWQLCYEGRMDTTPAEKSLSRIRQSSDLTVSSPEGADDLVPRSQHFLSDRINTESRFIELLRVQSVGFVERNAHVYNLQTANGYFTINGGIVTGNTMAALNRGALESWNQARAEGLLTSGTMKEVLTTPDDRRCPVCTAADGQVKPLDEPFETSLGRFMFPPFHPGGCRCTMGITVGT